MNSNRSKTLLLAVILIVIPVAIIIFLRAGALEKTSPGTSRNQMNAVPIEVTAIEYGPIEWRRTFSGALEARAEFIVAPKVAGRIEQLSVNIADPVSRGQVVATLDDKEYIQSVAQARADLAVAKANQTEARNALEIARREFDRVKTLRQRGVASESQLDAVEANNLAKQAELDVARAQVLRAEATLESAKIRLSYTQIVADWNSGDRQRVVAERFVDEGETVGANVPLLRIVALEPISAVIYVAERDYARLQVDQIVTLATDAFPGEKFSGKIARIAPIFRQSTRQARVELEIENPGQRLKPGMFIRATIVLQRKENVPIIPVQALTRRQDQTGVFLLAPDNQKVIWHEVTVGIQSGDRVEIVGDLNGRIVTLGQQMLKDGTAVTIPAEKNSPAEPPEEAARK